MGNQSLKYLNRIVNITRILEKKIIFRSTFKGPYLEIIFNTNKKPRNTNEKLYVVKFQRKKNLHLIFKILE